ncbi:FixH family protein [Litoribacillus peritrichatus]|uniref:FixH family protein n=1 Tax=Litoribacillus peritrichatus TaxID=718191 RepID=A0ABP7N539_9GAMM
MTEQNENTGNWNQPWLWFTLAPLILSVVLGLTMLAISIKVQDGLVTDDYSKEGLAINERIEREVTAKEKNIQISLKFDDITGDFVADFKSDLESHPEKLLLEIIHPVKSDLDVIVYLTHQINGRYIGQLAQTVQQKRYLRVSDPDNNIWVLVDEFQFPLKDTITLKAN